MATTYMIIENGQPMDGELMSRERLISALPFADVGAKVLAFDLSAAVGGGTTITNVTKDMVLAAWRAGAFDGYDNARNGLAGEYIIFPMSRSEGARAAADYFRHLRAETV